VWTFASLPVLAMQKKSSFIHNGIKCTFTEIKNFMDIPNHFGFIKVALYFSFALIEKPDTIVTRSKLVKARRMRLYILKAVGARELRCNMQIPKPLNKVFNTNEILVNV